MVLYNNSDIIDQIAIMEQNDPLIRKFIKMFLHHVPKEDLINNEALLFNLSKKSYEFIAASGAEADSKITMFDEADATNIIIHNKDIPFLVDSISGGLDLNNYRLSLVIHPVIFAKRENGKITDIKDETNDSEGYLQESVIFIRLFSKLTEAEQAAIKLLLEGILKNVRLAVSDWKEMLQKITEISVLLNDESKQFLNWLSTNNFTFLGYLDPANASLGILKNSEEITKEITREYEIFKTIPNEIIISKLKFKSPVHRNVNLDIVSIKVNGNFHSFVGLFTSAVYYQSALKIPLIDKKIDAVVKKSGFKESSHNLKVLISIIEAFPRDELLHIDSDTLFDTAMNIITLHERPRTKLFIHKTPSDIFVSSIVFIPRERFSDKLCSQIQEILKSEIKCKIDRDYLHLNESKLARYHLILSFDNGMIPKIDIDLIEKKITAITSMWEEEARQISIQTFGYEKGLILFESFKTSFPKSYQEFYGFASVANDMQKIDEAINKKHSIYEFSAAKDAGFYDLKIYSPFSKLSISSIMPVFDNMGFFTDDSHYYNISRTSDNALVVLHHFRLKSDKILPQQVDNFKRNIEQLLLQIEQNIIKKDRFISLSISAGFSPRQIVWTKAVAKYLKQIGVNIHLGYLAGVLETHSKILVKLFELFEYKFNPAKASKEHAAKTEEEILALLPAISDVTEDKIFRYYLYFIKATLRTNFYQKDEKDEDKLYISFKIKSNEIPEIPLPKPFVEVFVYSPSMEGIHLRGGPVARGGLRLSDRHDDYRLEVLGLMKTQMTKNSIIVPVGSKGGFIVKKQSSGLTREQINAENIAAYQTFLKGILDITDNVVSGSIVPPKEVIRHDNDDPYLVVAADKGTATFSDIANGISKEYNFWLADAFASGGSNGYDHKKIGITAKGGWVCVIRHFAEMGVDVFNQEFSVVGIGDMAGDVFGNFMLLSDKIKLVAAFNHMHIFVDPVPDAAKSFEERKRMFTTPGTSWADYNKDLISKGGGIFERKSKTIDITPEIQSALNIEESSVTPDQLIKYILKAKVDLLWNGGIGTYVKAKEEHPEHVGDKFNDNVRINGEDLRVKIVGEGGNLGFTQRGRIEYALKGGRINTDAIDNSAGVDCSDHEVNIKIAFSDLMQKGKVDLTGRNQILEQMTDEVSHLVLTDNKSQSLAISVEHHDAKDIVIEHSMLIADLEREGLLNRAIEFLPSDKDMEMRKNNSLGLTRPELAILLAYAKMSLFNKMMAGSTFTDTYFNKYFFSYFPKTLVEKYGDELLSHQLKKEIIATVVTNQIINKCGISFYHIVSSETECDINTFINAFEATFSLFNIDALWDKIDNMPFSPNLYKHKIFLLEKLQLFIQLAISWFIHNMDANAKIEDTVKTFSDALADIKNTVINDTDSKVNEFYNYTANQMIKQGISAELANEIALLDAISKCFTIVKFAKKSTYKVAELLKMYFMIDETIEGVWLKHKLQQIKPSSYWDRSSIKSMTYEIDNIQLEICLKALSMPGECIESKFDTWVMKYEQSIQRYHDQIVFIKKTSIDLSGFYVMAKRIKKLFEV